MSKLDDFGEMVATYRLEEAIVDGILAKLCDIRWNDVIKPYVATSHMLEDVGQDGALEIWKKFADRRVRVMPALPEEEQLFYTGVDEKTVWVIEDGAALPLCIQTIISFNLEKVVCQLTYFLPGTCIIDPTYVLRPQQTDRRQLRHQLCALRAGARGLWLRPVCRGKPCDRAGLYPSGMVQIEQLGGRVPLLPRGEATLRTGHLTNFTYSSYLHPYNFPSTGS